MKTIASLLFLLICCVMMAQPEIHYKPFRIRFESLPMGLGTLFIILGIVCFMAQGRLDASKPDKTDLQCLQEQLDSIAEKN